MKENETQELDIKTEELIIDAKHLSVILNENLILSNVSFSVKKGEMVYMIGKTGSGKSTLFKTIFAEIAPTEGEISVTGVDLKEIKKSKIPLLRRKLGMVFQDFQLLSDRNVIQNLLFVMKATGWKDKTKMIEKCNELLEIVKLSSKANSMPHQLSGGEQQRVCIARALINDPEIILADEPTGNLDPETSDEIIQILKNMNSKGISVLIVTHNYNLISKYPAKTYQFRDGKIEEILSEDEIMEITD